jgi:DNA-3-methyladenine glycosylase
MTILTDGPLPRGFYDRDTEAVARELLGTRLAHRVGGRLRVGRVVETEAYLGPHDLAAHSARGRTARTEVMFGPPGYAYVYMIYGMHNCLNAVTGPAGSASAVLIRALEPLQNIELPTNGPGRLCRALAIDRTQNRHDLVSSDLFFSAPVGEPIPTFTIVARPRIGVDYAGEWADKPLRFYIQGNPFVSKR